MSNSVSKELALVKELLNECKYEEVLQCVKSIEQKENLSDNETLRTLVYKSNSYYGLGQHDISLKIAEELNQKSKEANMPLFTLDALFLKEAVFYNLGAPSEEFYKSLKQHENLFNSIPREKSFEFQEREANLLFWKTARDYNIGDLDLALDNGNKSLALFQQVDPHSRMISFLFMARAYVFQAKGELNLALESAQNTLSLIPEGEYFSLINRKAVIYRIMGNINKEKGDLNLALEHHIRSLEIQKTIHKSGGTRIEYINYSFIIETLLAQKNVTQAHNYLQQFKEFNEKHGTRVSKIWYQYAHALILKNNPRMRDHTEAEKILKKIIEEDIWRGVTSYALKYLCELYLEEFQLTHQMEILDDIQPLIVRLQRFASQINSYSIIANLKLLQAKFALLQVSMVEARRLLTEAQKIADEHGLQLLAGEISKEHDRLLEELKLWESFKKEKASIAERLKLASVDNVVERLQGRRALEPLESSGQQPVSLLILAAGGVLLFSYPFSDEWKQDADLFGSFLSAFLTFSDEFFSQGLDRAKFGEETILLQSVGSFSICYLFRGQTYFAKQKLEKFVETIQKDPVIWETLEKFEKSSQVADLKDLPKMEGLINEVFLN